MIHEITAAKTVTLTTIVPVCWASLVTTVKQTYKNVT